MLLLTINSVTVIEYGKIMFMQQFLVLYLFVTLPTLNLFLYKGNSTQNASGALNMFYILRLAFSFFTGTHYNITLGGSIGRMLLEERPCGRNPSHPG